jgi:hypothetical protein
LVGCCVTGCPTIRSWYIFLLLTLRKINTQWVELKRSFWGLTCPEGQQKVLTFYWESASLHRGTELCAYQGKTL